MKHRSAQRQAYRLLEMERRWRIRDIPIVRYPKYYPADPSLGLIILLAAIDEFGHDHVPMHKVARRSLEVVWVNKSDIADVTTVEAVADASGLEGSQLLHRASEERMLADQQVALT